MASLASASRGCFREFARQLQADGWPCLELAGQAQPAHSPFAAVIDGLRRHERLDVGMDVEGLSAFLANRSPMDGRGSAAGTALPDATGQRRWRDMLLGWLASLAAHGPFCLLVDDAHWLDPSSIDLLRRFVNPAPTSRCWWSRASAATLHAAALSAWRPLNASARARGSEHWRWRWLALSNVFAAASSARRRRSTLLRKITAIAEPARRGRHGFSAGQS
jgi:hypothetical protein